MRFFLFILTQIIPWYLFPGAAPKDTSKVSSKPAQTAETVEQQPMVSTTPSFPETYEVQTFVSDIPETINVTFALPLNGASTGDMDFYCGALMAARELGEEGTRINVKAVDYSSEFISAQMIGESDVFIGPIDYNGMSGVLNCCPEGKVLVSPLDPRCREFVKDRHIVQVPVCQEEQLRDLARWAAEGARRGNRLVVILESPTDTSNVIVNELDSIGVPFESTVGYMSAESVCSSSGRTIFITASDKEYFVSGAVRSVSVLALQHHDVSLYCTSKVRSYENLNVELLHSANVHFTTNYQVDYNDKAVKDFVRTYRAFFRSEPNSYAFHGYDTMKYFTGICSVFGRNWFLKLAEYPGNGLQTGFRFIETENGMENVSVKRITYNSDYSITVQ